MWQTRYPLAQTDAHGNGLVADGPTVDGSAGNPWRAVLALRDAGIELPAIDDLALVNGADGLTVYVASIADGRWYAALSEV